MPALRHAFPSITPAEIDDMPWSHLRHYLVAESMIGGERG